ncbi:alpha/beta fold hydrolase [Psychrobacter sp.]|uniref:YheT family hydrolase n=1 Tax=Psychrobacter sp. TaxID=56811 RepID=UPI0025F31133|nr:alpha/beta fold hydrolase [Psychrobacter sp.]
MNNKKQDLDPSDFKAPDFKPSDFKPPVWLRNPHLQTILPRFIMPESPLYRRELVLDSLDESEVAYDFWDGIEVRESEVRESKIVDKQIRDKEVIVKEVATKETKAGSNTNPSDTNSSDRLNTPLVVLFHGMEGSSQSHYARKLAHYVHDQGWHFVVVHTRSCGGVAVKGERLYSAGDTLEVHHALQQLTARYTTIYCVGVSLGGNTLAKYMGEYGDQALCQAAAIFSAPLDLSSAATAMENFLGRKVYTPYLLNPIATKALQLTLSEAQIQAIKTSRNIGEFDSVFTAPCYGYRSENDYYHQASAMPYLHLITKPTLIVIAKDDFFLGVLPSQGDVSKQVSLYTPEYGGHIGFLRWKNKQLDATWFPEVSMQFYRAVLSQLAIF